MSLPRFNHRAVILNDGRVLVMGGTAKYPGPGVSSAEIYEPKDGTWIATKAMKEARRGFLAIVLKDGRVLAVGGEQGAELKKRISLASAEVFDPKTRSWQETGSMATPRAMMAGIVLPDGRVLVAGGTSHGGAEIASAELYDPTTGSWAPAGSMATPRRNHRATLLADGSVLIIGGSNRFGGNYLKSVELFILREEKHR
jgi:N-acetylneuraminic acid mutarotase